MDRYHLAGTEKISSLTLWALLLLILQTGCVVVKVDGFVHEKTQRILNTFYWTNEKASLQELIPQDLTDPVLVPDLQGILSSKSSTTMLRIITRDNTPLLIERLVVWSAQTGHSEIRQIETVTSPVESASGFWVDTLNVRLFKQDDVFQHTEEVRMSITWRYPDSSDTRTSDFVLLRKTSRDVAWVT